MNEQDWTGLPEDDAILPDGLQEGGSLFDLPVEQTAGSPTVPETPPPVPPDRAQSPETEKETETVPNSVPEADQARLERDVRTARQLYPELKELPEEVLLAVAKGDNFLSAYAVYRAQNAVREADRLRRENEILRQNQAAAARAPVRGVSGGGRTAARPVSDFERGFDADGW